VLSLLAPGGALIWPQDHRRRAIRRAGKAGLLAAAGPRQPHCRWRRCEYTRRLRRGRGGPRMPRHRDAATRPRRPWALAADSCPPAARGPMQRWGPAAAAVGHGPSSSPRVWRSTPGPLPQLPARPLRATAVRRCAAYGNTQACAATCPPARHVGSGLPCGCP